MTDKKTSQPGSSANLKPYRDLGSYLTERFGRKVYKLALQGGSTCPSRDGSIGYGGCAFCSQGGSGDFAAPSQLSVRDQISSAIELLCPKLGNLASECSYIAYFQSYTATYVPDSLLKAHGYGRGEAASYLRSVFMPALEDPRICALSVATRPDCLDSQIIEMLTGLNLVKPVFVELGLQTIHEETAAAFNRGYSLPVFEQALHSLRAAGLEVVVHLILGLPDETPGMMLDSVSYLAGCDIQGVKLQLLHILKDTAYGDAFLADPSFSDRLYIKTPDDYVNILISALRLLPEDIVIHRLTGDAPHSLLLYPMWSANKRTTLNLLHKRMKEQGVRQGDLC